ncbi:uncharacterized protein LOC126641814 [Myiozetetes cayanensis]|uniref:uncharacterized protein LOC126641814 n=1 Tax=Myiozetetes cayanensis TaxID=478635 RepID=UPI00215DE28D|nr:uncharacterized protein LOC126641814 [Myiozetetes cayanensis]
MGIAVSAVEKAVVDSLMKLAYHTNTPLSRQAVIDLLCWSRRRGLISSTQDIYKNETWTKIGEELWESVQVGTKGAKTLAQTYRAVKSMIAQLHGEAQVAAALKAAVRLPEVKKQTEATEPDEWPPLNDPPDYPPVTSAYPAMTRAEQIAWGLDDDLPPWQPDNEAQNQSNLQQGNQNLGPPEKVVSSAPAEELAGGDEPMDLDRLLADLPPLPPEDDTVFSSDDESPKGPYSELRKELQQQKKNMTALLEEMKRLDKDSKRKDVRKAYKAAHDTIVKGLDAIGDRLEQETQQRGRENECKKQEQNNQPRDPNFDPQKRYKGLIENCTVQGEFSFQPLVAPVVVRQGNPVWEPLDWKLVQGIQKSIMQYGTDNKLVKNQVTALIKYNDLVPADLRAIMELILSPTTYMLWLAKWQEALEEKQLDNVHLPQGGPLRVAPLDALLGAGQYKDGAVQATLHVRA